MASTEAKQGPKGNGGEMAWATGSLGQAACPMMQGAQGTLSSVPLTWVRKSTEDSASRLCCFPTEGDVYKAQTPTKDAQGALQVKEDLDVPVEVPVDQVRSGGRVAPPITSSFCSISSASISLHAKFSLA